MSEEWRDIPGYEGIYQVSDLGRVKRVKASLNAVVGRILKPARNRQGYLRVSLRLKPREGHNHYVAVLVASAFLGPKPPEYDVNHIDGDKTNNQPHNLEYVTRSENCIHAFDVLGRTLPIGERNSRAILTEDQVRQIRELYATGEYSQEKLGQMFGVSRGGIKHIVNRKNWRHVT